MIYQKSAVNLLFCRYLITVIVSNWQWGLPNEHGLYYLPSATLLRCFYNVIKEEEIDVFNRSNFSTVCSSIIKFNLDLWGSNIGNLKIMSEDTEKL